MQNIRQLVISQLPPGTRNPDDISPIDISKPFNIIVFIILPILIIILYLIWRKQKNRNKD
ncbi:adenylosuccinate synthetase [Hanstruepera ponticola]|uniref:adenylosuccinate synthetase n=1 Tax=Hanstruepera ponticola TaxID=2042995 RepID=UPI0017847AD8|nr:adenylosuccinate synthetase [Hanstruepera ponticola]